MDSTAMLAAFAADWARLSALVPPSAREALRGRLAELRTAPDRAAVADAAVRGVLDALPAREAARLLGDGGGHGDGDGARLAGASPAPPPHGYRALELCLLLVDGNPMVGPVLGPVRDRLLAAPAIPAEAEGEEGAGDPGLIVLTDVDGRRRLPAFQFEAAALPWAVVREVNGLLGAACDPWGAADWWLSANAWTGTAPAALLGRGRDPELLGAARTLGEG
ncbi:hypothetical protein ABZZ17_06415 [Streptomyces sp. NPDC006512]|uniref:hypothetical protein n=1 Tax=Streptomyces sp. NPDC006512 TaxID=3154307 RepID=UPI0033A9BEB5